MGTTFVLNFARWWSRRSRRLLSTLDESRLLDYVRYQLEFEREPSASTINHRLVVLRALYRFYFLKRSQDPRQCSSPFAAQLRTAQSTHYRPAVTAAAAYRHPPTCR